jgi:hypothetical protein
MKLRKFDGLILFPTSERALRFLPAQANPEIPRFARNDKTWWGLPQLVGASSAGGGFLNWWWLTQLVLVYSK